MMFLCPGSEMAVGANTVFLELSTILQLTDCCRCAGGELFERVAGSGPLREADARCWFVQLVDGLAHCHARGVFHRRAAPTLQSRPSQCHNGAVLQGQGHYCRVVVSKWQTA